MHHRCIYMSWSGDPCYLSAFFRALLAMCKRHPCIICSPSTLTFSLISKAAARSHALVFIHVYPFSKNIFLWVTAVHTKTCHRAELVSSVWCNQFSSTSQLCFPRVQKNWIVQTDLQKHELLATGSCLHVHFACPQHVRYLWLCSWMHRLLQLYQTALEQSMGPPKLYQSSQHSIRWFLFTLNSCAEIAHMQDHDGRDSRAPASVSSELQCVHNR